MTNYKISSRFPRKLLPFPVKIFDISNTTHRERRTSQRHIIIKFKRKSCGSRKWILYFFLRLFSSLLLFSLFLAFSKVNFISNTIVVSLLYFAMSFFCCSFCFFSVFSVFDWKTCCDRPCKLPCQRQIFDKHLNLMFHWMS